MSWICSTLGKFRNRIFSSSLLNFLAIRISLLGLRPIAKLLQPLPPRAVLDLLHAHRVSPEGLRLSRLNLFAIRISLHSIRPQIRSNLRQGFALWFSSHHYDLCTKKKSGLTRLFLCNKKLLGWDSNLQPFG